VEASRGHTDPAWRSGGEEDDDILCHRPDLASGLGNGLAGRLGIFFVFLLINHDGCSNETVSDNQLTEAGKATTSVKVYVTFRWRLLCCMSPLIQIARLGETTVAVPDAYGHLLPSHCIGS
jgi:hypothetical protein